MKFMHIADVHLGVRPDRGKTWSEQRTREIRGTFEKLLTIAEREAVELLLIAGDLFHFPPTITMLKELDERLDENKNMTTVLIAGANDYRMTGMPLDRYEFHSDTHCLGTGSDTSIYLKKQNVCVTGISYDKPVITQPLYDGLQPDSSHEDALQILLAYGGEAQSPIDYPALRAAGFDYLALGQNHTPQVIEEHHVQYSGSPEPIGADEIGSRGYILGEAEPTEDGWQLHTEWRSLSCREYQTITLQVTSDMKNCELQKQLQEEIDRRGIQHIYTVRLEGERNGLFRPDFAGLKKLYYIYDVMDSTEEAGDLRQLQAMHPDDLLGHYIQDFEGKDDSVQQRALRYGVTALQRCREKRNRYVY